MSEILLQLDQLSKNFGSINAVDQLSLTLTKGKVYGLLGPNGSGKSTTLGMILNVINPTQGSFEWYQGRLSTHEALKKIGAIIERPNFYPYMSAFENLKLICKIKECPYDSIEEKLTLVGLWERRNSKFSTYSLGMKQRLAIAAALLNNPDLLILDESINGLDPEGTNQIRKLINTISKMGTTILLASHLLDEVEKVCDEVIVLKKGVKYYQGPLDAITNSFGYFEVKATDPKALEEKLITLDPVKEVQKEQHLLVVYLKEELSEEKLFKELVAAELVITHFIKKHPSLETQFLTLTQ